MLFCLQFYFYKEMVTKKNFVVFDRLVFNSITLFPKKEPITPLFSHTGILDSLICTGFLFTLPIQIGI